MQNHTLEILQNNHPGSVLLSLSQVAVALSVATGTLQNEINKKTIRLKTIKRGGRRLVHLNELARYIDELDSSTLPVKRGRPRKILNDVSNGGDL